MTGDAPKSFGASFVAGLASHAASILARLFPGILMVSGSLLLLPVFGEVCFVRHLLQLLLRIRVLRPLQLDSVELLPFGLQSRNKIVCSV